MCADSDTFDKIADADAMANRSCGEVMETIRLLKVSFDLTAAVALHPIVGEAPRRANFGGSTAVGIGR